MLLAAFVPAAHAHRVNLFAWSEGAVIHTEATFNSGNKARMSHVVATRTDTGAVIAEGETSNEGIWSFTLDEATLASHPDILLTLNAGEGHANTWTVTAADYAGADTEGVSPSPAGMSATESTSDDMPPFMEDTAPAAHARQGSSPDGQMLEKSLERAMDAALERKLAPIRKQLVELGQHSPNIQDVMGGIGYIFGLMGIAAYMASRRKR